MKPANFDPAKKYPMVLWIHGGPWSMYSVGWSWAFQNWAANGYAVLWTNPADRPATVRTSSTGSSSAIPARTMTTSWPAWMPRSPRAGSTRTTCSCAAARAGGVLTAWIVGHTNRFRAAVSMRPVINWHSFVGNTDGASWYRQFQKYPWEDPMEYAVRSPLHYAANVTTPTMVMTGEPTCARRSPRPRSSTGR